MPGIGFLRRFAKDGSLKKISDLGIDAATPRGRTTRRASSTRARSTASCTRSGQVQQQEHDLVPARQVYKAASVDKPEDLGRLKAMLETTQGQGTGAVALGAKDDWTLTDWFESIYLRQSGVDAYDKLFSKDGDWTDPERPEGRRHHARGHQRQVRRRWHHGALGRAWTDGDRPGLRTDARRRAPYYEGGFVGGIATGQTNKDLVIGETIDWYPFPTLGDTGTSTTFGGDVIGALTDEPRCQGVHRSS